MSRLRRRTPGFLLSAGLGLCLCGCARGCTSARAPIHINPNMDDQPKYRAQAKSEFFYDGKTMREPVPGTVARGELREDPTYFTGKDGAGKLVPRIPVPVTDEMLERGRKRYGIYCSPCHDPRGDGKGILFERGNVPTASFHTDKIRQIEDGHVFDVITNGLGLMPSYRYPIPVADRWAIVAHVRRLEKERLESQAAMDR